VRTAIVIFAALLTASAVSASSGGGPGVPEMIRKSRSIGLPFEGKLENGVLLRETPFVRYTPEYARDGRFWGTWELVQLIHRAAHRVSQRIPGARLSVGELSKQAGGRIPGHHSHQNGRDVDIAFYMTDASGRPFDPWAFAAFDRSGRGRGPNEMLRFDDARNWELVQRLVADGDARIQYIFVSNSLKERLLREGERRKASPSVLARARKTLMQPATGHPHANHFHVRIYCSPANRPRCEDRAPFHAWYPGRPPVGSALASR
jgi:penicillin-insensitive murein DD-endopeptidase